MFDTIKKGGGILWEMLLEAQHLASDPRQGNHGLEFVEDYQRCFLEEMGFELRLKRSSGGGLNTKKGQRHERQERS